MARTFERDDLLSAAVIDADGKLIGRLTIDEIVDVVYEETDNDLRRMGGLSDEEDVFAPVSKSGENPRWAWLAVNLCTAFVASRVIDGFEHTISQLVALASLMPIVAGIGFAQHRQPDDHHDRPGDGAAADPARQLYLSDPA